VQLLDHIRTDLSRSSTARELVEDLGRIAEAASGTARAGKRVATSRAASRSCRAGSLSRSRRALRRQGLPRETEAVVAAAAQQVKAIDSLRHGAGELATLAQQLARAVAWCG